MKSTIKSYRDALDFLGNKDTKKFAHNTIIQKDPLNLGHNVIVAKYHNNIVASFFDDGTITFSSCGWKTLTTKERINWFLPEGFGLWQEKSRWFISKRGAGRWVFEDGIAIKNGEVYNAGVDDDSTKRVIKQIKKYVSGFVAKLLAGNVEKPSGADCWYCYMVTNDGQTLGEASKSDHILLHMEESYYVPSLLYVAIKDYASVMAKDGVARLWNGEVISEWQASIIKRDVTKGLTKYIKHALNIPS